MKYRALADTGVFVSELCLGAMTFGGKGQIWQAIGGLDQTSADAIVGRALDGGINWIDTAPKYGDGRSERALGWLLDEIDDEPYVSTKIQLDTGNLDDIPGQVEKSLTASLGRLRRDSVDVVQLHNPIGRSR